MSDALALDEFLARCEDVLDHWVPSDDAMVYEVGDGEPPELELADSYYTQSTPQHSDHWPSAAPSRWTKGTPMNPVGAGLGYGETDQ